MRQGGHILQQKNKRNKKRLNWTVPHSEPNSKQKKCPLPEIYIQRPYMSLRAIFPFENEFPFVRKVCEYKIKIATQLSKLQPNLNPAVGFYWEHLEQIPNVTDICLFHIWPSNICPHQEYLSFCCYLPNFDKTLKVGLTDANCHGDIYLSRQYMSWQDLSLSAIYQLFVTQFWPNYVAPIFLGP